jgi:hypothetical protein
VSPVKYELGSYIPEDDVLHSHCRENLKPHTVSEPSQMVQLNFIANWGKMREI